MRQWQMQVTDTLGHPLSAQITTGNSEWQVADGNATILLSERNDNILTVNAKGFIPSFFRLRSRDVVHGRNGEGVSLMPLSKDACEPLDLADSDVLAALARWLIDNPRIRIAVEAPTKADAEKAYTTLRLKEGLRPNRIEYRSGTDIKTKQIRIISNH